jgi:hypothetical protein
MGACGSNKEPAPGTAAKREPAAATARPDSTAAVASASADDVSRWNEPAPASDLPAAVSDPAADPDAVIARFKSQCPRGTKSPECRALRLEVEGIFLNALYFRRATTEVVDPRWYRLAAASETPQLACIGLNEIIWDPKRTAQDDALILRALESPYPSVRSAVLSNWRKVGGLEDILKRSGGFDYSSLSGVCIDSLREPEYGTKWAGGYPGAQFRPFASNPSRRWFTTSDPPEKVIAWFAARGKQARTAPELMADAQARFLEEMNKLSANPEANNEERMMQLMAGQGSDAQWSESFRDMEGIDQVKYVKIGTNQAVAIFQDYFLKATSIVAPQPKEPMDLHPDMEAAMKKAKMRSILGY